MTYCISFLLGHGPVRVRHSSHEPEEPLSVDSAPPEKQPGPVRPLQARLLQLQWERLRPGRPREQLPEGLLEVQRG